MFTSSGYPFGVLSVSFMYQFALMFHLKYFILVRDDSLGRLRILPTEGQFSRRGKCSLLPMSIRKGKVQYKQTSCSTYLPEIHF